MALLACHACGRILDTTVPHDARIAAEGRCPRCGSALDVERRAGERRAGDRRRNPPDSPGPPGGIERRIGDRRQGPRRRDDRTSPGG
jgi:DNA-directed RNA polymerase subunit RPC12/RpoP